MNHSSVGALLRSGRRFLLDNGQQKDTAGLDASLLLGHILKMDRGALLTHPELETGAGAAELFKKLLLERSQGRPVQYILNTCEFMGLSLYVDENVLIPRPDTETLAEKALEYLKEGDSVLDMCTGSGCVAVSLARYGPGLKITGTDISQDALAVAKRNADLNGQGLKINWIKSNLFEAVPEKMKFDIIVSNPPYIPTEEIEALMPNVKSFEPRLALDGGADGLKFYRRIAEDGREFLRHGGRMLLEIGYDQASSVRKIMGEAGYSGVEVFRDLAGHDRVILGTR